AGSGRRAAPPSRAAEPPACNARPEDPMLEQLQILDTQARLTAVIHLTIPRAEIRTAMGPAMGEVQAAVAAQGVTPAGPMFSHHLRMDPATFDFEVGVPVPAAISASGRVRPVRLPAATVARAVY